MNNEEKSIAMSVGISLPARTCPMQNGIGLSDQSENFCHRGCAWATLAPLDDNRVICAVTRIAILGISHD